jgi:hypothetical protein
MNAANWPAWCDADVWVPSDEDERWNAEHNTDWHDLNGDDEADPWTEADGRFDDFDDMAGQSAYLDAHEKGLKTF